MKVIIGSENKNKIHGVTDAFLRYYNPSDLIIISAKAPIEEFGHPKNLTETVEGAMNRARSVFDNCDYSVGIESGLMEVPHAQTGYMDATICAIYDGENFHFGFGTAFEWPPKVLGLLLNKGLDGSQAMREVGLTDREKIGAEEGAIFALTNGRGTRREQVEQATIVALVHIVNSHYYQKDLS